MIENYCERSLFVFVPLSVGPEKSVRIIAFDCIKRNTIEDHKLFSPGEKDLKFF
jgi:hypothetical protein